MKRIGVAISDPDQIIATPLELIERRSWKHLLSCIKSLITTYDAKALVIGLPLGFEGEETEMSILA
ncbi:Holliday junction resolvase RuvX, partial [Escherichia coli]|nr:Holliday junction resolvase RuvX [Escherichia coli]